MEIINLIWDIVKGFLIGMGLFTFVTIIRNRRRNKNRKHSEIEKGIEIQKSFLLMSRDMIKAIAINFPDERGKELNEIAFRLNVLDKHCPIGEKEFNNTMDELIKNE